MKKHPSLRRLSLSMKFKWYGWPGLDVPDTQKQLVKDELAKHGAIPIFFNREMADKHYTGFSSKAFQHSL
jgi:trehalose 6-phosphate synthase